MALLRKKSDGKLIWTPSISSKEEFNYYKNHLPEHEIEFKQVSAHAYSHMSKEKIKNLSFVSNSGVGIGKRDE